ncbi:DNA polymerase II [Pseudomaricurvus alcaniphilus]|uniref:DNA polymerase II n=1 Tax=Pseudomaricurvus alcaniphilus TaxID=1166482 RepID=UPI00140BE172|nr:DNA polymerase II [Pseudomaricurvus alcaniphilus]NHN37567.1 DNA polymerase II [Pseudomaricurvus alcaniphilus]
MSTSAADAVSVVDGFILSRHWDDVPVASRLGSLRSLQLCYWLTSAQGPVKVVVDGQSAVFFLPQAQEAEARALLERELGKSASHPAVIPVWEIRPLQLRSFDHQPVVGVYFREQRTLYRARELLGRRKLTPLEADIQPADRFLMERFITGAMQVEGQVTFEDDIRVLHNPLVRPSQFAPHYRMLSLDIETSMSGDQLYSIGAVVANSGGEQEVIERKVMMVGTGEVPASHSYLSYCEDETALLQQFLLWYQQVDADILIGWNVVNFDLRFLQRKADELGLRLTLGRQQSVPDWRQSRDDNQHYTVTLAGRLVMDGIDTLKSATYNFESFGLDFVGRELLQRGKLTDDVDHRGDTITEQFLTDKPALAAYNLEDCQLVWDIFVHTKLLDFAVERARLTGLAMDRFGGSVASFDNRYLPRLHRQGFVAPCLPAEPVGVGSPGGYVMDSNPGFYRHVLVLDFKSLYPSIIRTFHIDPLAQACGREYERTELGLEREDSWDMQETADVDRAELVPGYNGAVFLKRNALLPNLIGELWQARDKAKQQRNQAMSQAIKIIMNSFYGVLGTPGCRFFDHRLPSSITLRGHQILTRSRELIEELGHRVIYGDTDSVFVCLEGAAGKSLAEINEQGTALASYLNAWWSEHLQQHYQLQSFLEIEYETHYSRFLMPTIRGMETGSKKRYAGLIERGNGEPQLVFKGLEAVRTDWTPLAREFQRELYRRVFLELPYEDYIFETLNDIRAQKLDAKLYYRKRIRRHLADYTRNVPPHVQAARKADDWLRANGNKPRYERGGWIRYALTVNGAEPLERLLSPLDYELLIERQIAPIVDGIVQFLGTSFARIAGRQIGLF